MSETVPRAYAIGSMLRPRALTQARADRDAGLLPPAAYRTIEDAAVDDAIRVQETAGLHVLSDGEMRRTSFMDHLLATVTGIEHMDGPPLEAKDEEPGAYVIKSVPAVVQKITPGRMLTIEEYCYARGRTPRPVKVTIPSPLMFYSFWSAEHTAPIYPDPFDMFADWADMLRAELVELAAIGATTAQIDAPDLAILVDPAQREQREAMGTSVERTLSEGLAMIDSLAAVAGIDVDLHLCKGNFRSMWTASGGYDWLAEQVFSRTPHVHSYLLEFDDERSGDFAPLKHVPEDGRVVLGVVSTKTETLEPLDHLRARVAEAERLVGSDRLAVSTQCGFASVAAGANLIGPAVQMAKLARVAELADAVWGG